MSVRLWCTDCNRTGRRDASPSKGMSTDEVLAWLAEHEAVTQPTAGDQSGR
jgi:hypothetical protein